MLKIVPAAVIGSFALSVLLTLMVRGWARRSGFVDHPGGHKGHKSPTALGGGVALIVAIWLPILAGTLLVALTRNGAPPDLLPDLLVTHSEGIASRLGMVLALAAGALVLHIVGLLDDRRPLGPGPKFAAEAMVAVVLAGPLGLRIGEALGAAPSIVLTVLWIVLITNAFNFLDNMDGLSGGVAAIAAAIFAVSAMNAGQIFVPTMAWVMVGALAGFLIFNFAPASIFMGDSGSLVIGYTLAILTILTTYYNPDQGTKPFGVLVPLFVLAVPLYDVASVVLHRLRAGHSPFRGDQRHFSHRLVKLGMNQRAAVLTIYLATAATGLPAIFLPQATWMEAVLLAVQCLCVVLAIAVLEHVGGHRPVAPGK